MPTTTRKFTQSVLGFKITSCNTPNDGSWVSGAGIQNRSVTDSVTYGGNYSDWKRRLKSGLQCTTALTGVRNIMRRTDGHMLVTLNSNGCATPGARINAYKGDIILTAPIDPAAFIPDSNSITKADNFAKRGVINQLKSEFQSGTFLGELGETIRMLRDPAKSIRKGIDDYFSKAKKLKGSISRQAPLHRALAETWLGYAYGWKPLISDIEDAGKALRKYSNENRTRKAIYSAGSNSWFALGTVLEQPLQNVRVAFRRNSHVSDLVIYRGMVNIEPGKRLQMASRLFGFRPEEFVPTVWNLIPYSFLADYFTNIGDIVDAWSYGRTGLRWTSKTIVSVDEIDFTSDLRHVSIGYTTGISFLQRPYMHQEIRKISRAAYDGNFIPSFAWELPGVGSSKWTNLAALARVKF